MKLEGRCNEGFGGSCREGLRNGYDQDILSSCIDFAKNKNRAKFFKKYKS